MIDFKLIKELINIIINDNNIKNIYTKMPLSNKLIFDEFVELINKLPDNNNYDKNVDNLDIFIESLGGPDCVEKKLNDNGIYLSKYIDTDLRFKSFQGMNLVAILTASGIF